jgi:beta-lactamase class D
MRFLLLVLLTVRCASASPVVEVEPGECFMLMSVSGKLIAGAGGDECTRKAAPASTFKIPHALIALQTGVVDPKLPVQWAGSDQPFETWKRDHTLASSIQWSVYWYYQRTAAKIGEERMRAQLAALRYGSDTFERELTTFWTNGDLEVSPQEQVEFLARMFRGDLPVAREHVETVKQAMLMPPGKITNAAGTHDFVLPAAVTAVRAKTGNTRIGDERISWLVGQVEAGEDQYVFAARKRARGALNTTAGAEVARRALTALLADRDAGPSR